MKTALQGGFKVDLHTHSIASPDGSLTAEEYGRLLAVEKLHCIAVTDHNTITFAQQLQARYGNRIIIGEEISTRDGEIIGLYLNKAVPPGLEAAEAIRRIKQQGGLVYVPHPFESVRQGIQAEILERVAADVDIIETHNGRAIFQNRGRQAVVWAKKYQIVEAASSDAHGRSGWGRTYSILSEMPTKQTLVPLLAEANYSRSYVGPVGVLYPKLNRLMKRKSA